jgi:type II secretory pathway pseudopilin PulG
VKKSAHPDARERGLSLVELVVVALVVALLAAVGVPALLAAVRAAREARAVANIRTLAGAQMTVYATERRFASFGELFDERYLADRQFERMRAIDTAAEEVSDGVYLYSFRFDRGASGLTIDADPDESHRSRHRWFRYRLGRTTASPSSGGEGTLYVAPPSASPPSAGDYELFRP